MKFDRLKRRLKEQVEITDIYPEVAADPAGDVRRGGTVRCFRHDHADDDPSMYLTPDGRGYECKATGCRVSGDIFDMWAYHLGLTSEGEDFFKVVRDLGIREGIIDKSDSIRGDSVDHAGDPPNGDERGRKCEGSGRDRHAGGGRNADRGGVSSGEDTEAGGSGVAGTLSTP